MATIVKECTSKSWADIQEHEDEVASSRSMSPLPKLSYALIASKGTVPSECIDKVDESDDDSDFIVVTRKRCEKKDMVKKCEGAVLQWAKTKGQVSKTKCNEDDEIICNRCSSPFVFNAKTKEKYTEKGWKAPKICKMCSQVRFEERKKN